MNARIIPLYFITASHLEPAIASDPPAANDDDLDDWVRLYNANPLRRNGIRLDVFLRAPTEILWGLLHYWAFLRDPAHGSHWYLPLLPAQRQVKQAWDQEWQAEQRREESCKPCSISYLWPFFPVHGFRCGGFRHLPAPPQPGFQPGTRPAGVCPAQGPGQERPERS